MGPPLFQNQKGQTNRKTSHSQRPPPPGPKPPVSEQWGLQGKQEEVPAACLSPFLLTNTRLPVSALPHKPQRSCSPAPAGEIYGSQSEACPAGSSLRRSWNASRWGPLSLPGIPPFKDLLAPVQESHLISVPLSLPAACGKNQVSESWGEAAGEGGRGSGEKGLGHYVCMLLGREGRDGVQAGKATSRKVNPFQTHNLLSGPEEALSR